MTMLPLRKLPLSFALLALALAAPRAQADLLLDDFDAGIFNCGAAISCSTTNAGIGAFAATRELTTSNASAVTVNDTPSLLTYSDDGNGSLTLTYDLGGQDVTAGSTLATLAFAVSSATISELSVTITDADGTPHSHTETVNPTDPSPILLSLASFAADGVVLQNVDSIVFSISNKDGSLALDRVTFVPEPATALMLLVGLLGLAYLGRARREIP